MRDDFGYNYNMNNGQTNYENPMPNLGMEIGLYNQTYFVFPLWDFVQETEFPRGYKIPKFTKFVGGNGWIHSGTCCKVLNWVWRFNAKLEFEDKIFPSSLTKSALCKDYETDEAMQGNVKLSI